MFERGTELRFGVRPRVVLKYCAQLSFVFAILVAIPLVVSFALGELAVALRYAAVIAALVVLGLFSRGREPEHVQINEGLVIVALAFLGAAVLLAIPLMGYGLEPLDAFFEAVSGVTTTGLSTVAEPQNYSIGFHFARAWMQWFGGLGIVVLSLALVIEPGTTAKGLAVSEPEQHHLAGGTRAHARRVVVVYLALTATGIALLAALGVGLTNATLYALAAVSTGGFSPHASSLGGIEDRVAQCTVLLIALAGAMPLLLYLRMLRRSPASGWSMQRLQLFALLTLCLVAGVGVSACLWSSGVEDVPVLLVDAPLLAVSAQTTAGFSTVEVGDVDAGSKLCLMVAMAIGGGLGSTAGGVKVIRLLIVLRLLYTLVSRTGLPQHAVFLPRLAGRTLEEDEIRRALVLVVLFAAVVVLSWLPFLVSGHEPLDALFDVVSATGTVGLSTGVTGEALPASLKLVLCADMLLGRLEILAWLVLFYPATWLSRRRHDR